MPIDYQKRDGVAYIMLNHPAKANGTTWEEPGAADAERLDKAFRSGEF